MANIDSDDMTNIINRAKGGDKEAFSYLYETYFSPLYRYIYFRVGSKNDAEDMIQEVFLKAYSSFGRYSYSGKSPLAYFYTIAKNVVIDNSRKKKILVTDENLLLSIADKEESPEELSLKNEEASRLREKIAGLPEMEREVIVLKFMNGLENKEIAEITGKTIDAIRQIQSRGLKSLRNLYKNHEK